MGQLSQAFLDDLLGRIDLVNVIEKRIQLKKAGKEYQACCPFHEEKTPSFTVSPAKQFYHCFGCGAHGNAIHFLRQYEGLNFIEAVVSLAHSVNLEVPESTTYVEDPAQKQIYAILERACAHYQHQLKRAPQALEYLKQRGLSEATLKHFRVGYAPDAWQTLARFIEKDPSLKTPLLDSGLIIQHESGRLYDRFRARILFPIIDPRGRVIGFGGRVLDNSLPKYMNSPEIDSIFHKNRTVYGLHQARQHAHSQVFIVEGYMDVLALAEQGIHNSVATLGTALTPHHLTLLLRYYEELVFCFDGDRAGKQAAWRALTHALPLMHDGIQMSVMFLPDKEDPDSLIRKIGKEAFIERAQKSTELLTFLVKTLEQATPTQTVSARISFARKACALIDTIPSGLFRDSALQYISDYLNISIEQLEQMRKKHARSPHPRIRTDNASLSIKHPAERATALLLQYPRLIDKVTTLAPEQLTNGVEITRLLALLDYLKVHPNSSVGMLMTHWSDQTTCARFAELSAHMLPISEKEAEHELITLFSVMKQQAIQMRINQLLQKAKTHGLSNDEKDTLQKLLVSKSTQLPVI